LRSKRVRVAGSVSRNKNNGLWIASVYGISFDTGKAANRLKAQGEGPIAPVAANRTVEGRAKKRRVELVEQ
jgi:flagellar motor protein MotB